MKQFKPLPVDFKLASNLSQRIFQLRELRNMTVRDLARMSRFPAQRIDDIEAGIETWLSDTDRQILSKALGVEPQLLKEVEVRPELTDVPETYMLDVAVAVQLNEAILSGQRDLKCPDCGSKVQANVQDALDMEGNPIKFAKAYCTKCPFVLRL